MGRKAESIQQPAEMPEILPAMVTTIEAAQSAEAARQEQAYALAHQMGYQGTLAVGVLEDEIRFYQQRSVEALLETGKRLLLLRELTPKGNSQIGKDEFADRLDSLGIAKSSAYRLMQAAEKARKSDKLSFLSSRVKNTSAFLELITHDDDVIENLAQLDNFDRMSAGQLRAKAREMEAEQAAAEEVRASLHKRIDKLEREKRRVQTLPPDEALAALKKEAASVAADAEGAILGGLRQALIALRDHGAEPDAQAVYMAGLVGQVQAQINALRDEFRLPDVSNAADRQLAADMAEWDKE